MLFVLLGVLAGAEGLDSPADFLLANETKTAISSRGAEREERFYLDVIYVQHSIFISHLLSKIMTQ